MGPSKVAMLMAFLAVILQDLGVRLAMAPLVGRVLNKPDTIKSSHEGFLLFAAYRFKTKDAFTPLVCHSANFSTTAKYSPFGNGTCTYPADKSPFGNIKR
jgi:hypothetical protein